MQRWNTAYDQLGDRGTLVHVKTQNAVNVDFVISLDNALRSTDSAFLVESLDILQDVVIVTIIEIFKSQKLRLNPHVKRTRNAASIDSDNIMNPRT